MTNGEILLQAFGEVDEELIPEISFDNDKKRMGNARNWLTITEICAACAVLVMMVGGLFYSRVYNTGSDGIDKGTENGLAGRANGGSSFKSQSAGQEIIWEGSAESKELDQQLPTTSNEKDETRNCNALNYLAYYAEKELEEARKSVLSSEVLKSMGEENAEIEEAYKLYSVQGGNPVTVIKDGKRLTDYVSEEYVWIVILNSRLTLTIAKKQGGWETLGYSKPSATKETIEVGQLKSLNENLESLTKNGVSIQTVQCVDAPVYHMRLVYVQGEKGDYYIPYGSREDLTNLTNGKVYTAQEIADILE